MIVYREAEEEADPRAELAACAGRAAALAASGSPGHDDVTTLLIDLGMVEAAVADELLPAADAPTPATTRLRRASLAAGRLFRLSRRGGSGPAVRAAAEALARDLRQPLALPRRVRLRVPEGYAYYALYPETYLAAARQLMTELRPERVVCIGIRSIGTSLSAVVAAACEARGALVESFTLRPRGHPFDRSPLVSAELEQALRSYRSSSWFLIVDEGPGLSGSSFCGTATFLAALGVPDARIVFFPSHLPDPAGFRSPGARARWPLHRKAHVGFEEAWLRHAPFPSASRNLSGGAWRGHLGLPADRWPAVQPQHERRKYLAPGPVLHKFAGLGRFGARTFARAQVLASAGLSPTAHGLSGGFLAYGFIPGQPLTPPEARPDFLAWAAAYLRYVSSTFAQGASAAMEPLVAMTRANLLEGLGPAALGRLADLERQARSFGQVPAVAVDGRVLPHEWLRTPAGWLKTDAVDHHADHFYPGLTDIAWDVAGLGVELGLDRPTLECLAGAVGGPALAPRLPFYRLAYLAFRLGYTTMAAETLAGSPDGARMAGLAERYRRLAWEACAGTSA